MRPGPDSTTPPPLAPPDEDVRRLCEHAHSTPHDVLGVHPVDGGGVVVRAWHPEAVEARCLLEGGGDAPMTRVAPGLFAVRLPEADPRVRYRLHLRTRDGHAWEAEDPYRHLPTVGEVDRHLLGQGDHHRLWDVLGANPTTLDGVPGTAFAVWAPSARRVSVVGDFNGWDGRVHPMRALGSSGVFELFLPGVGPGTLYKFEILTAEGALRVKTDPLARAMEPPPGAASRVTGRAHVFGDDAWMTARRSSDPRREPMAVYEVHLGSWVRGEDDRMLGYRELAPRLADHVERFGFTHVELMPVSEHAFYGSWGYQVTGYFAPTGRYGEPDDLRWFVDHLHQRGIGVLLDWVPAHFPKDDYSLRRFDGTALYEHEDPRRGEHPDWGTLIFNLGRSEVRNFLVANALYWLEEFHFDGLRVDAVASMLYLDYSRRDGEWVPNAHGGRENVEAIEFFRHVNSVVRDEYPGAVMVAEESTAWPNVSRPPEEGGLGFTFKWNMGWMHDTLHYFARNPLHRRHHQGELSFSMVYEYSERFVMPLSHDEVVHGKGSLLGKMPGDAWQQLANLKLLLAYQYLRPGKMLLFMGTELAPATEWNHDVSLDWSLERDGMRQGLRRFLEALGALYRAHPALWRRDHEPSGFSWIDCSDAEQSTFSWERTDGEETLVAVLNMTPVPRDHYRIGVPAGGRWRVLLSSDDGAFAGSGYGVDPEVTAEASPFHGRGHSVCLRLPPLGAVVLARADG